MVGFLFVFAISAASVSLPKLAQGVLTAFLTVKRDCYPAWRANVGMPAIVVITVGNKHFRFKWLSVMAPVTHLK